MKCFQRFVILIVLSLIAVCGVLFGHWADLSGRYIFPFDWTTAQWIKLDLFQCTSSEHYVLKIVLLMFFLFHPVKRHMIHIRGCCNFWWKFNCWMWLLLWRKFSLDMAFFDCSRNGKNRFAELKIPWLRG